MNTDTSTRPDDFYRSLPKVELHRHLEGSLRFSTIREFGRSFGLEIPNTDYLRSRVLVRDTQPLTFQNFLSKFDLLRQFYRAPEVIRRVVREAIEDAAADNIRYLEMRFTPVALGRAGKFPLADVIDWVCDETRQAAEQFGITARLITSVNRHEDVGLAEQVARLASERLGAGIVGLDLAGNEAEWPSTPFIGLFRQAWEAGLRITVHAGEWGGAGNVAAALVQLGAERIGHGVRIMEDPSVVALARERTTVFEVCLTSNYQTGVVPALNQHPLPQMLAAGLNVTLNTDDPSISQITLTDEYRLACESLGMPLTTLRSRVLAAARAAFLPASQRQRLVTQLEAQFPVIR
jgi:adenosine deaminase